MCVFKEIHDSSDELSELLDKIRSLLGLNKYESKLYLAILMGAGNPKEASEKSGVPLPRVYDTVKSLEKNGLIERKGKWYAPRNPVEALNNLALARINNAVMDAVAIRSLGETLSGFTKKNIRGKQAFQVIRGLEKVFSFSLTLIKEADEAFFVLWKAVEKLDIILPLLTPFLDYFYDKKIIIVIPREASIGSQGEKFITKTNAVLYRMNGFLMDMLIVDEKTVVIGVPDPSRENEVIALVISHRDFASALKNSVLKNIV